jgi:hypothetical protein
MKNILCIASIALIFIAGCTGVKTVSSGLADEAFLEFVGDQSKYSEVSVTVGEDVNFIATVNKPHANRPKGEAYAISPGSHVVTVSSEGEVVFRKKMYLSTRETRIIELP